MIAEYFSLEKSSRLEIRCGRRITFYRLYGPFFWLEPSSL